MNSLRPSDRLELALMTDECIVHFVDRKLRFYAAGYGLINASRIQRRTRFFPELDHSFFECLIVVTQVSVLAKDLGLTSVQIRTWFG
jgi:hypothetical protein